VPLVDRLAAAVDRLLPDVRVVVAVDGPDAAGKSTLADTLAERITRPTLRASIDDWHNPREVRLRQGHESPVGYYENSFDYPAFKAGLLDPFRAGATSVRTRGFDFRADAAIRVEAEPGSPVAALVLEGVFLLRPELLDCWNLSIYVQVQPSVTLARAVRRDAGLLGGEERVRRRYEQRYLPGQEHYRAIASPGEKADVVIDNTDPANPLVVRWSIPATG
jgi:uridine kinase